MCVLVLVCVSVSVNVSVCVFFVCVCARARALARAKLCLPKLPACERQRGRWGVGESKTIEMLMIVDVKINHWGAAFS